ncbi:CBS domain-containing protein, partial [bacterium]|nr:CBS domain-containing protein [bacterium]
MENLTKHTVYPDQNIRSAIKKMDAGGIGFIVCTKEDKTVIGVISDGDFRRAILSGISLDENVLQITNRDFKHLSKGYSNDSALELFNKTYAEHIPVLENGKLVEIITKDIFFNIKKEAANISPLKIPLVIMAGGKGTRLDPFTRILPKPLIPIGDKPMIEVIMSEFARYGI